MGKKKKAAKSVRWAAASGFASGESDRVARPQDSWAAKPDNSLAPFVHPLAVQEGAEGKGKAPEAGRASALDEREEKLARRAEKLGYSKATTSERHPLSAAIRGLAYEEWMLECQQAQAFKSFEKTPFTYVDTEEKLAQLAAKLDGEGVIAVDLENHSLHSYQGFLCLMQISTRTEDFIVDSLALRERIGPALGHIFADAAKVKVMHGATSDIVWLQRCHGIYLANLFDTGQAARVLALPSFGLAYLLLHYCNYKTNKTYQMADWRQRPLPQHLVTYARADTHFLLYMYDRLRIDLQSRTSVPDQLQVELPASPHPQGPMGTVLQRSASISLQMYQKPVFTETTYLDYYSKQRGATFTPKQLAVFAGLYAWRDAEARRLDESPEAVLAKSQLMDLARGSGASADSTQVTVKKICNRKQNPARACQEELCRVIESAVEQEISYGSPMKKKTAGNSNASGAAVEPKGKKDKEKTVKKKSKKKKLLSGTGRAPAGEVVASVSTESKVWETLGRSPGSSRAGGPNAEKWRNILNRIEADSVSFLRNGQEAEQAPAAKPKAGASAKAPEAAAEGAAPVSSNDIRGWADGKLAKQQQAEKRQEAEHIPESLSKNFERKKARGAKGGVPGTSSTPKPKTTGSFDYSSAREKLKSKKRVKRGQNVTAQSFFSIPDENLVKPAKRRKQPTTGNRSMSFK